MSSPELVGTRAADLHEAIIQRRPRVSQIFAQPRSDSPVESIQMLSLGEISSSRVHIPALQPSIEQSHKWPFLGAVEISSRIHADDLEIPGLDHDDIYPVAPENFQQYEKRRRM